MSDFYRRLYEREWQARSERFAEMFLNRPLPYDYQGCANDERQKKIAELQDEIDTVKRILDAYVTHGGGVWSRILARLERELAEVTK